MQEMKRYYQYGSVALNPERILDDPDYEIRVENEKRRVKNEARARKRAHTKALRASKLSSVAFCAYMLLVCVMLFSFIYLQNEVQNTKRNITSLEEEISRVNTLNDAKKSRIDTSTNLDEIRSRAINELGMVYADQNHIYYYDVSDEDFLNLY